MQIIENIFLLQRLRKGIASTKELDLRPLGKVIIFRDRQTDRTFLLHIDYQCTVLEFFKTSVVEANC